MIAAQEAHTYAAVQRRSVDLAGGLIDLGVRAGDRVALLVDNRAEYAAVKLAVARAGAVAVPLNYSYTADEVAARLRRARARVLVTVDATLATNVLRALDEIAPGWETSPQGDRLPDLVVGEGDARSASQHDLH